MKHSSPKIVIAVVVVGLTACTPRDINTKPDPKPETTKGSWLQSFCAEEAKADETTDAPAEVEPLQCNDGLNATLWVQTSAEYDMLARQSWFLAERQLEVALKDKKWSAATEQGEKFAKLPPAVIVDVDETVLDNSRYQARLAKNGTSFAPDTWAKWCDEKTAPAVPGALEFAQFAASKGVRIFYVTNRASALEACTRANLESLGFPMDAEVDTLLTKSERPEWGGDKGSRRSFVAAEHRVLLLVGDQLGDFVDGSKSSTTQRQATMEQYLEWWGTRWIVLPNPAYGHWEGALVGHDNSLDERARKAKKFNALRP